MEIFCLVPVIGWKNLKNFWKKIYRCFARRVVSTSFFPFFPHFPFSRFSCSVEKRKIRPIKSLEKSVAENQPLPRLIERNIFNSDGTKRVASEVEQVTPISVSIENEEGQILSIVDNRNEYLIHGNRTTKFCIHSFTS